MRALGTICIWLVTVLAVAAAGGLAFILVSIPLSLDPTQVITAGSDPWMTALYAAIGFVAVLVMGIVGLRLWHTARMKPVAVVLTIIEVAAVGWASLQIYGEYF